MLFTIVGQSLKDIEVICVDDGSTDSSYSILQEYAQKDSRVKVLQQKNLYAGVARNKGMTYSNSEYIVFWDCDDFFEKDALELMYKKAKETDSDICVCGVDDFDSDTGIRITRKVHLNVKLLGEEQPFSKYENPKYIFNFTTNNIWNKMFKVSFIKKYNLRFADGDYSEETMFTNPAIYYAERISYVNHPLIHYRVFNCDSAVFNVSKKKTKYYKDLCKFYAFMKNQNDFNLYEESLHNSLLAKCIGDLEANKDFNQFSLTYNALKQSVFHELGLIGREAEYFRNPVNFQKMQYIIGHEPGEYLLWRFYQEKHDLTLKNEKTKQNLMLKIEKIKKSKTYRFSKKISMLFHKISFWKRTCLSKKT